MEFEFLGFVAAGKNRTVYALMRKGAPHEGKPVKFFKLDDVEKLWAVQPLLAKHVLGLYEEAVTQLKRPGVKYTGGAEPGLSSVAVFTP